MTTTPCAFLSRKQIAQALGESVDMLAENERRWGLDRARVNFNRRVIRYRRAQALAILAARGMPIDPP